MKKLLLSTALSFVFVLPAYAEDPAAVPAPVVEKAAEATVDAAVSEAKGVVEEAAQEAGAIVVEESAKGALKVTTEDMEKPVADVVVEEKSTAEPEMKDHEHEISEAVAEQAPAAGHAKAHADWGYAGAQAAPYWGTLDEAYHACLHGKEQSPINISKFLQEDVPDLNISYNPSSLSVSNNGHTIQVNYEAGSSFTVGGVQYELLQSHFHTPSEHYLDGAPYPMEVHFVHKAADGALGIVGVMMKVGEHNRIIEGIWQNAPINTGDTKVVESVELDASALLPESLEYYKYGGSLTTPPCSEGVQWHVMKDPIELSEQQLKAFQALFPVNARPVQSLNDRVVTGD